MLLEKLPLRIFVDLSVFRRHGNMKKSSLAPLPFFFLHHGQTQTPFAQPDKYTRCTSI